MKKLLGKLAGWLSKGEDVAPEQPPNAARAQLSSIDECACCKLPLPLRLPKQGERVGNWQCVQCGYRYVAVIDEHRHPDLLAHIRPAAGESQAKNEAGDSPEQLDEFVSNIQAERERRIQKRSPLETILLVTPLDADQKECGEAFLCRTADFSSNGIRLTHPEPIDAKWLWLEHLSPQSEQVRVLVKVHRIRVRDNGCEIGARFDKEGEGDVFAQDENSPLDTSPIDKSNVETSEAPTWTPPNAESTP